MVKQLTLEPEAGLFEAVRSIADQTQSLVSALLALPLDDAVILAYRVVGHILDECDSYYHRGDVDYMPDDCDNP